MPVQKGGDQLSSEEQNEPDIHHLIGLLEQLKVQHPLNLYWLLG